MKSTLTLILLAFPGFLSAQPCLPNTNSLDFDGSTSHVNLSPATSLNNMTGPLTVEAWINASAWGFNSAQNTIFCTHGWFSGEAGFVLRAGGSGELSFNIAGMDSTMNPVGWREVISPVNSLQLNTWHHVAGTFSGTELKVFIDGNEVASTLFNGTVVPSVYGARIGMLADANQSPGRYFNGFIDEVRVWSRALTSSDLMSASSSHPDPASSTGLTGYLRFNEGNGTTASDLGTGASNGSIVNASWIISVPFNEVPPAPLIGWNGTALTSNFINNNQWFLNGNPIAGATGTSHVPTQVGSYTVSFTGGNGCSTMSQPFIVSTVGIMENAAQKQFNIWPNPVSAQLNIHSVYPNEGMQHLYIVDMHARRIVEERIHFRADETLILQIPDLEAGQYHLILEGEKGKSSIPLIILGREF